MGLARVDWARFRVDIWLNTVAASPLLPKSLRNRLLRRAGVRIDRSATLSPRFFLGGTQISIGARTWINYGVWFDNSARIDIGSDVDVGQQVLFCTSSHELGDSDRRGGANTAAPISIGDGTWIGSRATILSGVRVGAGCVIAAGAVVTADCQDDSLYAGVPARLIRKFDDPSS